MTNPVLEQMKEISSRRANAQRKLNKAKTDSEKSYWGNELSEAAREWYRLVAITQENYCNQ